jgi:hypothetical protein
MQVIESQLANATYRHGTGVANSHHRPNPNKSTQPGYTLSSLMAGQTNFQSWS